MLLLWGLTKQKLVLLQPADAHVFYFVNKILLHSFKIVHQAANP
jgi:hypothetical protein